MACLIVSSVISLYGMPAAVRYYTLMTSIEMMKKREIIDEVLKKQKAEKTARTYRVFQAMRLMRREYMQMISVGGIEPDSNSDHLSMTNSDSNSDYGADDHKAQPSMSVVTEI